MQLTVLYFAALRDLVGVAEEQLELGGSVSTVEQFVTALCARRPELAGRLESVRVACNEEFVQPGDPVADGDVLALIPPVSGG